MTDPADPTTPASAPADPTAPAAPQQRWTLKGVLLLAAIFIGLPFGALSLLWHDRCHHQLLPGIPSPDGLFVAQQVITDCGTSMKVASEVRVHHATGGQPTKDKAETLLLLPDAKQLPITWRDGHTVVVKIPPKSELAKKEPHWDGVTLVVDGEVVKSKWQQGLEDALKGQMNGQPPVKGD